MIVIMKKVSLLLFAYVCLNGYKPVTANSFITSVDSEIRVEIPSSDPPVNGDEDVQGAASEVVAVAEPNIAALLGIGTLAGNPGLLSDFHKHGLISGGGRTTSAPSTPDISSLCGSNSDALTNLLVYQYLSGGMPGSTNGLPNIPSDAVSIDSVTSLNPLIQPLRNVEIPGRASLSVSTTITTRVITMDASTNYFTSTTSYVTTVTQITSSVLPIIFRGSKLITTITDRMTQVVTATEFKTSSSVLIPSIVQTLPVEITFHHKSTLGPNGQYTLDRITTGATKVIEKPISTSKVNFDNGLNLKSLDLSNVDLSSLTALIDQYSDQDNERERQRDRFNSRRNEKSQQDRRFRFRDRRPEREEPVVEEPKFNVLSGFTYSDRPVKSERKPQQGGRSQTASLSTRYSKFRKKTPLRNNNVTPQDSDRESEPYSATTSRRTFSPAHGKRHSTRSSPRSRFYNAFKSDGDLDRQASNISGVRRNRETANPMRRTGRTIRQDVDDETVDSTDNHIKGYGKAKDSFQFKTTVLTMYMTGPKPGHTVSLERTITLRNLSPQRKKRSAAAVQPNQVLEKLETTTSLLNPPNISPEDVISLLKGLDRNRVNEMLNSLHKWVDYYIENMSEETDKSNFITNNHIWDHDAPIIELSSSHDKAKSNSNVDATTTLPTLPRAITAHPALNTIQFQQCPSPVTHTETVFKTVYLNA